MELRARVMKSGGGNLTIVLWLSGRMIGQLVLTPTEYTTLRKVLTASTKLKQNALPVINEVIEGHKNDRGECWQCGAQLDEDDMHEALCPVEELETLALHAQQAPTVVLEEDL